MNYFDYKALDGVMFQELILSGAAKLEKNIDKINDLNVFPIPDGDTGDNMFLTLNGGIKKMVDETDTSLAKKASALAEGMLFNARGNSGVILSQLFSGIALGFKDLEKASITDIIHAFNEGVKKAYSSVNPPVEGTMLTVAREPVELVSGINYETIGEFAKTLLDYMYKSLENTPELLNILKEAGVIDSGGAGLYVICDGVMDALNGNSLKLSEDRENDAKSIDFSKFTEDSELVYGYCTEFLLRLMNKKVDVDKFNVNEMVDYLKTIGDSIVAFKDGSIVKCHVHTMTPYKVLECAQKYGEFLTVKIENMTLQHNEITLEEKEETLPTVKRSMKKYASIVVSDGEGFKDLFKELGVDAVIDGGQGKNPSINDFIEAFDEVNAENIFVFPNNSNIILAANQAKALYDKSNIFVLETKNVGEAYSALSMLDYSLDEASDLYNLLVESKDSSITALICKATRDVNLNGVDVKENDYISMIGKKIIASSTLIEDNAVETLKAVDEVNLLTLFFGKMVSSIDKEKIKEEIKKEFKNIELYDMDGGQDTFDIIMIIE